MTDYKELIEALREEAEAVQAIEWDIPICTSNHILDAADAIEQLVNDRNASVDALNALVENIDAVPVVYGHKIIRNRPYAAQYIYVGDDGYGNLVKKTDCSGTAIKISPAILSNPIEYCSECGKRMDGIWQNFCDNCGAKMGEERETDERKAEVSE